MTDFDIWIDQLRENVIQDEYGYEPGEFTVFPEYWRPMFYEGLTPKQAFDRALKTASEACDQEEADQKANWARIQREDAAAVAKQREPRHG